MKYRDIKKGIFISRPNRFIANIIVDGKMDKAHVKNTGRCRELLLEGATVYLQHHDNVNRSTKWSLIGVQKGDRYEWLKEGKFLRNIKRIKPEFTYGESRIDFLVETDTDKVLIEVKGVTLEEDNAAMFPKML